MSTNNNKSDLPLPPTFSQMMEDLEIMSADEKIFQSFQLENDELTNENPVEQTSSLINKFLSGLETLQRLDKSLTTQNDSTNDQLEKKLYDIIEQLQMCLTKLQTNSSSSPSNTKKLVADNKK